MPNIAGTGVGRYYRCDAEVKHVEGMHRMNR